MMERYAVPTPKEMTVEEIEQKLGYKIKIKGESYNESINK